ncbi:unnamed protein product [Caenorhabditis angaria]|uniref:Rho-GAP domain-containing protein n=1 Tax=Caenorhabditis angaria TaxID=860376 RepID=A0A9P1IT96_9PELO|nr:unnamed protein product [Caenorhabditis angaria]
MTSETVAEKAGENEERRCSSDLLTTMTKKGTQHKQEKAIAHDLECAFKEFRAKMSDQLKCLGDRTDVQLSSLSELQDYFRKRGEIEGEYACKLEKLSKSIAQKHKSERVRREGWQQHTSSTVWHTLVEQTKEESKKRQLIGELYGKQITASIEARCEDLAKISKRCREVGSFSHTELNRVLNELQTAMKTYQLCYAEMCGIERKKKSAEDDVKKYEEANSGKFETSRRHRSLVKYMKRREEKFEVVRLKCTKARNEYLLCVKAANAALHRFFAQDLSYLIDCMDLGMDFWLRAILEKVIEERKRMTQHEMDSLAELGTLRSSRQKQIEKRLEGLQFETDEVWKSLEASEKQLLALYNTQFEGDSGKWRSDLHVTYQYYLKKFEMFLLNGNLAERLEARSATIGEALAKQGISTKIAMVNSEIRRNSENFEERKQQKTKRIGAQMSSETRPRPRLFGGSLDEYVEATGEEIPLLVESAIGYLSRFSLRNQGLFRVSGSQSEINRFKEAYERGEDQFAYLEDGTESNSAAGVLKLYFRELREPIFPIFMFEQFCDCAKAESSLEFVRRARELVAKLPISHILLLRFLFQFLSHLCEFADENMMEPHNLAICFGPTLLPIPEGKDQVFYHNYVNELVRNLILHADEVFPRDLAGPIYDKYAMQRSVGGHFIEENDLVSEDEEDLHNHNHHQSKHAISTTINRNHHMLDSTYESADRILLSSPMLSQTNTSNGTSPHGNCPEETSSRTSSDQYKEDIPPLLRTEMPLKIANELNSMFKNNSGGVLRHSNWERSTEVEEDRDYVSPPPPLISTQYTTKSDAIYAPMIKQRAATLPVATTSSSNGGSLSDMSVVSAGAPLAAQSTNIGVRIIGKSSLRDQLQLIRKENNGGGVLDATTSRPTSLDDNETGSNSTTTTTPPSDISSPQPDIINSARPNHRAISPTLDDIVAALNVATNIN